MPKPAIVRLYFAETYFTGQPGRGANSPGNRVFTVTIEGTPVVVNLDLNATAGPLNAYVVELQSPTEAVSNGRIDISFSASVNRPIISAIEVFSAAYLQIQVPTPTPTPSATSTVESPIEVSFEVLGLWVHQGNNNFGLETDVSKGLIPFYDEIVFELEVVNNTGHDIAEGDWEPEIFGVAPSGSGAGTAYGNSVLNLRQADSGLYSSQFSRVKWGRDTTFNDPIQSAESITRQPHFSSRYSGIIQVDYRFTDYTGGTTRIYEGAVDVADIAITRIDFSSIQVRSLIFWLIFNETSEDTDETPFFQHEFNEPLNGVPPSSAFLRTAPYCSPTTENLRNNAAPDEQPNTGGWDQDIQAILHCNPSFFDQDAENFTLSTADHRYIDAQVIVNGLIYQERSEGTDTFFAYARSNFRGSIGTPTYSLWAEDVSNCSSPPEGSYVNAVAQNRATQWLTDYLYCLVNEPSAYLIEVEKNIIYQGAYSRIMPQVTGAVNDLASYPEHDIVNGATARRNASTEASGGAPIISYVGGQQNNAYIVPIEDVVDNYGQELTEEAYQDHIQSMRSYRTTFPTSVVRPVFRTQRIPIFEETTVEESTISVLVGYQNIGYQWLSIVYQSSPNPETQLNNPR